MLEQRYKELVADIDGIVWEADAETLQFTFVSEQAERLLGYPTEDWFAPGFWSQKVHPEDRDWAVDFCERATATLSKHDFEYRMLAADGRTVWLRDIVSVIAEPGERTKLRGIMVDVTERKRAEQQRQAHLWFLESMDRVHRAVQGASDLERMMSDVLEAVLTILQCDRAWLLYPCVPEAGSWRIVMERTRPEFPGLYAGGAVLPDNADIEQVLRALRASDGPLRFGAGSERPLTETPEQFGVRSMMAMAIYPKHDQPYVFGLHQCTHERVWTPEEERLFQETGWRLADALTGLLVVRSLRESERKLEQAEHLAHVGYWERDFVAGTLTLSDEARSILGVPPSRRADDLASCEREWREAVHPEDRDRTVQAAREALGGGPRYDVEYRVTRLDGVQRVVHSRGDVTWDEAGRPLRMFGFMQDITERKQAEAQLFEIKERFRLLAESSLTGIYLIQDGLFRYCNPAMASMFGYAPDEIVDKLGPTDLSHPDDRARVAENVRRRVAGEVQEIRYELRGVRKDGSTIYVEVHGRRIEHGGKTGVIGTLIDVTERRNAELQLRASEARFRTLVDHATDAFYLHDEAGTILDVNRQACESLGYSREELIGSSPERIDPDIARTFPEALRARLRDGEMVAYDTQHLRKDGTTFPVEVRLRPFWEGGRRFSVSLARDMTERKRAEWALIESHALLNSVVEGTSDAVFVKDLRGRYLMINSAGARFMGKTVDEVIGKDDSELFTPETAWPIMERDRQVIDARESQTYEETGSAAGVTRTYLSTKGVFRDAQGNVRGLIGIARDVTDLKRLEEQFRQAQKMEAIGRLAGGVAHDFNNLLTAINGYSELAFAGLAADDPIAPLLAEIRKAGERATNLTRQLLAFSRKQVLHPQLVNLNDLLSELCKLLRPLIGEDIEIVFAPAASLGVVKIDASQFEQAVINLAVNARDAMPDGGRLTIETRDVELDQDYGTRHPEVRPGRYVMVAVSDTGHGMDSTTRIRIFEPFFTTKPAGKGTGLGLAMVYGFLKQSGGHVEVYSEEGHGTTIKVYLPCADEVTRVPRPTHEALKAPGGSETVLLVEDEDAVRNLSKLVLTSSGYTVLEARDGQEALAVAERHPGTIHLLVTDLIMPRLGGRQLAEELTRVRPGLRVLLMSGYTDEAVMPSIAAEANLAFLQKPFSPVTLARKVRSILDSPAPG